MTEDNWLIEFGEAADSSGFHVLPDGWREFDNERKLETVALALARLKRRADSGEVRVADFFRLHGHWQSPPAIPGDCDGVVRVGFVTPAMTYPGGAERWIQTLVAHHDPRVIWSGVAISGKHRDWQSVKRLEPYCPVGVGVKSVPVLGRESDVIVVWGVDEPRYLLPDFAGPIVAVSHGCGDWSVECLKTSHRWCQYPMAVSTPAAQSFPESLRSRVKVVWNGVDHDTVRPINGGHWFREQARIDARVNTVSYIGRFSWEKNPTAAARAASALGDGWQALVVGDGWKYPQITEAIRRISPDAIIHPKVEHVGDALAASDVFLLASPAEGMSLGLIEAWMAGRPVVATRVGAVPELESRFGQLVVPVSVHPSRQELADACLAAMSPSNARVVQRARTVAMEHLRADQMAARYCDAFVEAAACDTARQS